MLHSETDKNSLTKMNCGFNKTSYNKVSFKEMSCKHMQYKMSGKLHIFTTQNTISLESTQAQFHNTKYHHPCEYTETASNSDSETKCYAYNISPRAH